LDGPFLPLSLAFGFVTVVVVFLDGACLVIFFLLVASSCPNAASSLFSESLIGSVSYL
jgi:hypothetical protein